MNPYQVYLACLREKFIVNPEEDIPASLVRIAWNEFVVSHGGQLFNLSYNDFAGFLKQDFEDITTDSFTGFSGLQLRENHNEEMAPFREKKRIRNRRHYNKRKSISATNDPPSQMLTLRSSPSLLPSPQWPWPFLQILPPPPPTLSLSQQPQPSPQQQPQPSPSPPTLSLSQQQQPSPPSPQPAPAPASLPMEKLDTEDFSNSTGDTIANLVVLVIEWLSL